MRINLEGIMDAVTNAEVEKINDWGTRCWLKVMKEKEAVWN